MIAILEERLRGFPVTHQAGSQDVTGTLALEMAYDVAKIVVSLLGIEKYEMYMLRHYDTTQYADSRKRPLNS